MNLSDLSRNSYILHGFSARRGYLRWWHSFRGVNRQTGETRTFFVEFFVINPGLGGSRPILGQHPYFKKRGMKPSYVMVKAGVFPDTEGRGGRQIHAFYPLSSLQTTGCPLVMRTGGRPLREEHLRRTGRDSADGTLQPFEIPFEPLQDGACLYSEDRLTGYVEATPGEARHRSFMTDAGYMEWDLEIRKSIACHTGIFSGRAAQALRMADSFWHGEGILSFFRGSVILDGQLYEVNPEFSSGYADKCWGQSFNSPWFQLSCGKLSSSRTDGELRNSALAVNGISPRMLGLRLPGRFLLQLTYMGEDFDFTRCRWEVKETERRFIWHILAKSRTAVLKLSGSCKKEQMLHLQYENPDGRKPEHPLWAGADGIGTVQLYRRTPAGRELLDTLKLEGALCIYRAGK